MSLFGKSKTEASMVTRLARRICRWIKDGAEFELSDINDSVTPKTERLVFASNIEHIVRRELGGSGIPQIGMEIVVPMDFWSDVEDGRFRAGGNFELFVESDKIIAYGSFVTSGSVADEDDPEEAMIDNMSVNFTEIGPQSPVECGARNRSLRFF